MLKRFGEGDPGPLSFPMPGWTLALDIPAGDAHAWARCSTGSTATWPRPAAASTWPRTAASTPSCWPAMYPRLDEWRAIRAGVDPDQALQSDLARRLDLL